MRKKKWLSALLAVIMTISLFPSAATAYAGNLPTALPATGQARIPVAQAAVLAGKSVVPAQNDLVTGEGFTWEEETQTLTITASTGDYQANYQGRPYQDYRTKAKHLVVDGDANTVIGTYAFYYFSSLETITIKNCGNIENKAFGNCTKLETVTIGSCGDFEEYVFQNCEALTQITIGTCGNLVKNMFSSCSALESVKITEQCGDIGNSAFLRLSKLSDVSIAKCGNIGENAFEYCTSLERITLNCGNIGKTVFRACTGMKELTITNCGDISNSAFLGMTNLETVTIGACGDIGSSAFSSMFGSTGAEPCNSLKNITIGQCGSIGASAFYNLKNLEQVTINNCTKIGEMAFWAAGAPIKELTLKNCTIEESAFRNAKITTLVLDSVGDVGDGAFNSSTITNVTLSNISSLGKEAFAYCKGLTNLTIENLVRIDENSFKISDDLNNNVETITLKNVGYIGNYAFYNFKNLKKVIIDGSCSYVGAHAFTGCDALDTDGAIVIQDGTKLGYSDSLVYQSAIFNRVTNILKDTFDLIETQAAMDKILPEGWTSVKYGENNRTEQVGDTQLTKEAKWNNEEKTVADVLLKAYYSANQQMDFIIVADCSNSMSGIATSDASNSNFYNMQSKIMDVTEELLSAKDLDTRVAFSTFGDKDRAISRFFEKGETQEAQDYIWHDIVNYESDTNYSTGLAGALELVKQNKGRNTTVIFISDGQPYYSLGELPEAYYGEQEAEAIKTEGVQIISVLQQVSESELASSQANMERIADQVFASTDLAGFSTAVNAAVDYAYTTYVVTDTVDPAFELDESSVKASAGKVELGTDAAGNTTITWIISGMPFTEHNLSFQEKLKADEKGIHATGQLDTNEGKAVLNNGGTDINAVASPVLARGVTLTVEKIWENDNDQVRPDSIEVTLLRDGEAFETVELTEAQGWRYTWNALDEAYDWSVREAQVPAGYTGEVVNAGGKWMITNTYEKQPEEPVPSEPEEPSSSEPEAPSSSEPDEPSSSEPEEPSTSIPEQPEGDAPGTGGSVGVVWWMLLMAAAAGGLTATILCTKKRKVQ